MNYLISIDFWKNLFHYSKNSSNQSLPSHDKSTIFSIHFKKRKFVISLDTFSINNDPKDTLESSTTYDKNSLNGYLILIETPNFLLDNVYHKFTQSGHLLNPGELLLVVYPEWKRFQISYQIFQHHSLNRENPKSHNDIVPVTTFVKVDLRFSIEENSLLEYAGKNNLELMRVRLAPEIALPKIYNLKVTIIGTGTLGCNLARNLLAWGIEHLTFVDNNTVSSSNLLRQSLFESGDLGQPKTEVAARRVGQIFPPCKEKVKGVEIHIPMPDHPECLENLAENLVKLEQVVESSDLVFLCTDNRESRWLPSLIAVSKNKPLINLAIGFDSWTVMRHPLTLPQTEVTFTKFLTKPSTATDTEWHTDSPQIGNISLPDHTDVFSSRPIQQLHTSSQHYTQQQQSTSGVPRFRDSSETVGHSITSLGGVCIGNREIGSSYGSINCERRSNLPEESLEVDKFGCYFCPSIEGVRNSVLYQTEDERCTVTRGGASTIASACAVELAISLVNSKRGFYSIGGESANWTLDNSLVQGQSPQQLRGNLNNFTMQRYLVKRNNNCVCCSRTIRQFYEDPTTKLKFLETVCKDSSYLSIITGSDTWTTQVDDLLETTDDYHNGKQGLVGFFNL